MILKSKATIGNLFRNIMTPRSDKFLDNVRFFSTDPNNTWQWLCKAPSVLQ